LQSLKVWGDSLALIVRGDSLRVDGPNDVRLGSGREQQVTSRQRACVDLVHRLNRDCGDGTDEPTTPEFASDRDTTVDGTTFYRTDGAPKLSGDGVKSAAVAAADDSSTRTAGPMPDLMKVVSRIR